MADEVVTELVLELSKTKQALKQAERAAKKTGNKIGKGIGKRIETGLSGGLGSLKRQILGVGAALAAAFAGRAVIAASEQQEEAITALNQSLAATGEFSLQASKEIQEYASALQQATGVGDEIILQNVALAQGFTQNKEAAQELTSAALDFAQAAQINFTEAVRRLGRATQGSTDDVAKFAPEIRNLTRDQLAAGEATRILAERFKGAAAAQAATFGGARRGALAAFGDLLEVIGDLVTKSPVVIGLITKAGEVFAALGDSIQNAVGDKDLIGGFIKQMVEIALVITRVAGPPIELFFNFIKTGFETIKTAALGLISFFDSDFKAQFDESMASLTKTTENIFDFNATESAEKFLTGVNEFVNEVSGPLRQAGEQIKNNISGPLSDPTFFDEFAKGFVRNTETMQAAAQKLATQLRGTLISGVAGAFESVGTSLGALEGGLSRLGQTVLRTIGTLAIQMGTFLVTAGLGFSVLPGFFSAAGAIAAGGALIVLGGVLKGVAGRVGPQAATGGGGGGGGGGGVATAGASVSASAADFSAEDDVAEPKTGITLIVEGNIMDTRETGLQLIDILNESFDQGGTEIRQS